MSIDQFGLREEASLGPLASSGPSVWRLGDVLEELLGHYGLTPCNSPEGKTAVCGQSGLFATTDLPAVTVSAY
jgi:hypothetical protein